MVREFDEDDFDAFIEWHHQRGIRAVALDALPSYGLVVENIAMGFLVSTDTEMAILDFFITNPETSKVVRDQALDEIVMGLLRYGDEQGFTTFKCDTQLTAIADRANKFGFQFIGDYSNFILRGFEWEA